MTRCPYCGKECNYPDLYVHAEWCFERSGKCDDKCLCDCHQAPTVSVSSEPCDECDGTDAIEHDSLCEAGRKNAKDVWENKSLSLAIKAIQREERLRTLEEVLNWIKINALMQTTYSDICWDDGDIFFKRDDTIKHGDWSQEEWDTMIKDFNPEYLYFEELKLFLESLKEVKEK